VRLCFLGAGGVPQKYGRVMPNISAYNCAAYEVNLSATERMSRQSVSHSLIHSFTVSRAGIMARLAEAMEKRGPNPNGRGSGWLFGCHSGLSHLLGRTFIKPSNC